MNRIYYAALTTKDAFEKTMSNDAPIGDRLLEGLKVTVLGLATVFLVLAILWLLLYFFKLIFYRPSKNTDDDTPVSIAGAKYEPPAFPPKAANQATAASPAQSNDAELIAVITAAIEAYAESEGLPRGSLRVVSFKRSGKASPWGGR
ncbi:MAG TPA: OadG family protein [Bacillota bacterium]|nr:OadG family protein [Clostridiales bacterium]HOQ14567.1 OadG family protein [Bacillota bacterium]